MKQVKLTPKKVALAIGVSESSMKRWCDRGLIDFQTTAGGHRRLLQKSVIDFVRNSKHSLVRSELLGLPAGIRPSDRDQLTAKLDFLTAVLDGQEQVARQIVFELFISGLTIADIGDKIVRESFSEIGRQWECGRLEIFRERRACEITLRVLSELRTFLPEPHENAPIAIGGSPGKSGYTLPTMLIEMLFLERGWRAQSLGSNLPFSTLMEAVQNQRPRLFWLSVSHVEDENTFLAEFKQFRQAVPRETVLAVGGNALTAQLRQKMQFSAYGDTLKQLEALAESLKGNAVTVNRLGNISNY